MQRSTDEDLHFGVAASETTVKAADLSRYRIVYFATQGLVAGELKGLSEPALALTLPDQASATGCAVRLQYVRR
ncbi:MAG: hypothetical protein SFW09_14135 [Hyphomicrobiaceae bacterium]|nr:hypothetical protein [Hyphomicrobiaceae bacterium]